MRTRLLSGGAVGTNTPVPDPDPLDQCRGHGTHVAVSKITFALCAAKGFTGYYRSKPRQYFQHQRCGVWRIFDLLQDFRVHRRYN